MSYARDSQRIKVYRWERANIPGWKEGVWRDVPGSRFRIGDGGTVVCPRQWCGIDEEMSLDECTALVERVWAAYRPAALRMPKVTPGYMARRATGTRDRINLPRWARQPVVVLHEVTHSLLPTLRWIGGVGNDGPGERVVSVAWHGPEFVRLYIELLVRYHAPAREMRGELLRTARAAKIKVGRLQDCRKPVRREARRGGSSEGSYSGD